MSSHIPRIVGGCSRHAEFDASKCIHGERCGPWYVVDCCGQEDDKDVDECGRCGKQVSSRCNYDDDTN